MPALVRKLLADDGPFTADLLGMPVQMLHTHRWIEDAIFWDGAERGYEPATLAIWVQAAARSSCIVDVGANTGLFALSAQAYRPNAFVVAFEPVPEFCTTLARNINLNGFAVVVRQAACADYRGDREDPHPAGRRRKRVRGDARPFARRSPSPTRVD